MSSDSEVREEYLKLFKKDSKIFADSMAHAFVKWRAFDEKERDDEERSNVSALVYSAINLHIDSLKLFLSGHNIASGNLFRQVIESIALALLCSNRDVDVLERFMKDKYSSTKAVRDVFRHIHKLGINEKAIETLEKSQEFYHKFSHITRMTIAMEISFSQEGKIYLGASFDKGKIDAYTKEVKGRVELAKIFPNFVDGISSNVSKW